MPPKSHVAMALFMLSEAAANVEHLFNMGYHNGGNLSEIAKWFGFPISKLDTAWGQEFYNSLTLEGKMLREGVHNIAQIAYWYSKNVHSCNSQLTYNYVQMLFVYTHQKYYNKVTGDYHATDSN